MKNGKPPDTKRAALYWYLFGLPVIPTISGEKRPAIKRSPWLEELSREKIEVHWDKYPDNEVAIVLPDGYVVLDADSPEAALALERIETSHGVTPNLIVKTRRGEHHYFKIEEGVYVPSSTHDSEKYPNRIDVLGAKRQVIVPPSTGKTFLINTIEAAEDLVSVDQPFIDSVFLMNDQAAPRPPVTREEIHVKGMGDCNLDNLEILLNQLDPDCGYDDWTKTAMAIFHETAGSDEGFRLFDHWSSKGYKYLGRDATLSKWKSFHGDVRNPITIGTLVKIARDQGIDTSCLHEDFTTSSDQETIVVYPEEEGQQIVNQLAKYSLTGKAADLERKFEKEVAIVGKFALSGQMTVFYAAPNTGKTLLMFHFIVESIRNNLIDPNKVYYLNMDDTAEGLITKLRIAEEYGFNVLAPGYEEFEIANFGNAVRDIVDNDQAKELILFLDTLKKLVDLMDKKKSSNFASILRDFVMKGGTVISLAHTNKNKQEGRSRYCGTSDMVDDSDCVYIIETITEKSDSDRKVIEFINEKRRGNVPEKAAYSYDNNSATSYMERLLSVEPFDETEVVSLRQNEALKADAVIIETIKELIVKGINTKMRLAHEAGKNSGISQKLAIRIIEKYTGHDSKLHRWNYTVEARGKQVFYLLDIENTDPVNDFGENVTN